MIKIKETKSVTMEYDEENKEIWINLPQSPDLRSTLVLPLNKIFQVKRGLESAVQRYYRKK